MSTSFVTGTGRGPLARLGVLTRVVRARPVLVDVLFVLALCGLHVFDLALAGPDQGVLRWAPLVPSVPATCALLLRRRFPRLVFGILMLVTMWLTVAGLPIGALNLAVLLAVYTISVRSGLPEALAVSAMAMLFPVADVAGGPLPDGILTVLGAVPDLAMIVVLARVIRAGRRHRSQLEHTVSLLDEARDQLAADAATVERARITREFHDIVSHTLSVVALRAGVARAVVDRDPEHARRTLGELEQASRAALEEMRTLLGALRNPEAEDLAWHPTPGLDEVDELVESVRGGGVSWRLERRGAVRALGSGVEITAYRIVQEAVTNVLKHAGSGRARVLLDYGRSSLSVAVTNHVHVQDGSIGGGRSEAPGVESGRAGSASAGHGLVGLRERVALLGGMLAAHPLASGFHIEAVLPCAEDPDLA